MESWMKTLFIMLFVMSSTAFAGIPRVSSDVEIIKTSQVNQYENIPRITKMFKGERNSTQTEEVERRCQEWVMAEILKKDAPVYRAWCTRKIDVILREYQYIGNVLIKNW